MTMGSAIEGTATVSSHYSNKQPARDAQPGSDWQRVKHHLVEALKTAGSGYTLEDVEEEITKGNAVLWAGESCAIVTRIVVYPQKTVLLYWLAGGDLQEMRDTMLDRIKEYGRLKGATEAVSRGNLGVLNVMTEGWTEQSVMSKEL